MQLLNKLQTATPIHVMYYRMIIWNKYYNNQSHRVSSFSSFWKNSKSYLSVLGTKNICVTGSNIVLSDILWMLFIRCGTVSKYPHVILNQVRSFLKI